MASPHPAVLPQRVELHLEVHLGSKAVHAQGTHGANVRVGSLQCLEITHCSQLGGRHHEACGALRLLSTHHAVCAQRIHRVVMSLGHYSVDTLTLIHALSISGHTGCLTQARTQRLLHLRIDTGVHGLHAR